MVSSRCSPVRKHRIDLDQCERNSPELRPTDSAMHSVYLILNSAAEPEPAIGRPEQSGRRQDFGEVMRDAGSGMRRRPRYHNPLRSDGPSMGAADRAPRSNRGMSTRPARSRPSSPGARGRVLTLSPLWEPRITSLLSLARTMSASWPTLCLSQGQTAARCSVPADGVA